MQKLKNIYAICLFGLTAFSPQISWAENTDSVPIPPKRPDVMNVSPAYIEYLRNKSNGNNKDGESPEKSKKPSSNTEPQNINTQLGADSAAKEMNPEDVLTALSEGSDIHSNDAPTPQKKPTTLSNLPHHMNNLATQAGESKGDSEEDETTLVSFALKPGEVKINKDIENFLNDHALKLFKENKDMVMQIHAYATPIDEAEYSDMRLSLARALEIRSFLIKNNIEAARLKLMPMGRDEANNSDDRIDLLFIEQKD